MRLTSSRLFAAVLLALASAAAQAQGFKFSNDEEAQKSQDASRQDRVRAQLASPCRNKIHDQKILVLVGESRVGRIEANQAVYGEHFNAINSRLRAVGL